MIINRTDEWIMVVLMMMFIVMMENGDHDNQPYWRLEVHGFQANPDHLVQPHFRHKSDNQFDLYNCDDYDDKGKLWT